MLSRLLVPKLAGEPCRAAPIAPETRLLPGAAPDPEEDALEGTVPTLDPEIAPNYPVLIAPTVLPAPVERIFTPS